MTLWGILERKSTSESQRERIRKTETNNINVKVNRRSCGSEDYTIYVHRYTRMQVESPMHPTDKTQFFSRSLSTKFGNVGGAPRGPQKNIVNDIVVHAGICILNSRPPPLVHFRQCFLLKVAFFSLSMSTHQFGVDVKDALRKRKKPIFLLSTTSNDLFGSLPRCGV